MMTRKQPLERLEQVWHKPRSFSFCRALLKTYVHLTSVSLILWKLWFIVQAVMFMTTRDILVIYHYENMPMQDTEIFKVVKNEHFQLKKFDIFLIFAQNIDCGYTLEPPRRGSCNKYPQSMLNFCF